ncbi:uncharacterized protein LOC110760573 [Prunus avium]|uniref:Uncharacterized protein LOC110760573 n=1 Tax=Prunus avium TaxID=42229 RepID=A0A6P5SY17_PRUAV|nr:uncharacterized protein LOC110760573 [Prunus avium]
MTVNSPKIEGLLGMLTIRLNDDNFVKWFFQFKSVFQGYDLFDHFDGSEVCPPKFVIDTELGVTTEVTDAYKSWIQTDKALLSLLLATLSDDAIDYAQSADSIEKYLLWIKTTRDQLIAAGERITDDDVVITALNGLPQDYDMIRIVLFARDSTIGLTDLRAQLLNAERQVEIRMHALSHSMSAMMATLASSQPNSGGYNLGGAKLFSQGSSSTQGSSSRPYNGYNGPQFRSSPQSGRFKSPRYHGSRFYYDKPSSNSSRFKQPWSTSSGSKPHVIPECQICSKRGHTAANCFYRNTDDSDSSPVIQCQICGKKGHGALDCYHRANFAFQ